MNQKYFIQFLVMSIGAGLTSLYAPHDVANNVLEASENVFDKPLPLSSLMKESTYVVMAKVTVFDPKNERMVLTITDQLLGNPTFRQVHVIMKGDEECTKLKHVPILMKRLALDLSLVMFIVHDKNAVEGQNTTARLFTNGTWFLLSGKTGSDETSAWELTHGEPILRRTYNGSTEQMRTLLIRYLSGRSKLPGYDEKVEPGFGPEISN